MAVKEGMPYHVEGQFRWERKQWKSSMKMVFVKSFRGLKVLNSRERLGYAA